MNTSFARVVSLRPTLDTELLPLVEAFLVDAGRPLTPQQIGTALGLHADIVQQAITDLEAQLEDPSRGLCVVRSGYAVQLIPKPRYLDVLQRARQADAGRLTLIVDEYLHSRHQGGMRKSTQRNYRPFLKRFIVEIGKPVEDMTTRDIRLFLMSEEQNRGNCRSTIARKINILRAFFAWLEREDFVEKNPMRKIDPPKVGKSDPKYLTYEEVERIRDACRNLMDRLTVEVLYSSGLRVSEASALDWDDINLDGKYLQVRDGKGGKARRAPLSTKAVMLLRQYREIRKDDNPWVFQSRHRQRMVPETIWRRMRNIGERAGLRERLTPHRLRHSLATHLLAAGVPIDVVQVILGHESVATTQVYARTQMEQVEQHYRRVIP